MGMRMVSSRLPFGAAEERGQKPPAPRQPSAASAHHLPQPPRQAPAPPVLPSRSLRRQKPKGYAGRPEIRQRLGRGRDLTAGRGYRKDGLEPRTLPHRGNPPSHTPSPSGRQPPLPPSSHPPPSRALRCAGRRSSSSGPLHTKAKLMALP